jgi:hypothetical protein
MRRPVRARPARPREVERQSILGSPRDRVAVLSAIATFVCVVMALILTKDRLFLMPGPLTSAHGAIENCSSCHTKSGSGKVSWIHGLVAGDPLADSKACLTCHKMPESAFNAHSASAPVLDQSTSRLAKLAARAPVPQSARAQSVAFPTGNMVARGLFCATCHQEHQGVNFKLSKISNEQCRSCHVVKFDSFDRDHPNFTNYPFKRRTRIVYDHAGHFGSHFPEMAKKRPTTNIPIACSTCHNSVKDRRVMGVAPFEQTCAGCHLDQITSKERVSGPKGVAFLALPGLDLNTLRNRKASIGEWPAASEAELTPFMKVMIGRTERGHALIKTIDRLNLQDLSGASNDQIKAVSSLVWEIKRLFHALIKAKAADALADLKIGGARLGTDVLANLTANIPRDVVISAHQQWLPNLGAEMTNRPVAGSVSLKNGVPAVGSEPSFASGAVGKAGPAKADNGSERLSTEREGAGPGRSGSTASETPERSEPDRRQANQGSGRRAPGGNAASNARRDPQDCLMAVFGVCVLTKDAEADAGGPGGAAGRNDPADRERESDGRRPPAKDLPRASRVGLTELAQLAPPAGRARSDRSTNAKSGPRPPAGGGSPPARAADQTDDLLNLTEEERRGIAAPVGGANNAAAPDTGGRSINAGSLRSSGPALAGPETVVASAQNPVQSVVGIESDVDSENWAEHGGWYRQDYTIYYRPTGHKDRFIYSWLSLTGPHAPRGDKSPAAAVFDYLTKKDAQGSCTKCHSVDDTRGRGRIVNFTAPSIKSKQGRFTNFIHEPHFGVVGDRGCLTCHRLEKDRPYLKSYEQSSPQNFVSNFSAVGKELCQTCHTSSMTRQDCLTCHKYHVNGAITPITDTKLPTE